MRRLSFATAMVLAAGSRALLASGDGTFGLGPSLQINDPGIMDAVTAGDFNGDGKLDLAGAGWQEGPYVFLQDPRDREVWKRAPDVQAVRGYFLRSADFDGDGNDDLVSTMPSDRAYFFRSQGDGNFSPAARIPDAGGPRWIAVGDFDRDGALDMAGAETSLGRVSILRGGGDGSFSLLERISLVGDPPGRSWLWNGHSMKAPGVFQSNRSTERRKRTWFAASENLLLVGLQGF